GRPRGLGRALAEIAVLLQQRRHTLVTGRSSAVDFLASRAVVPLVGDNAVSHRRAAGQKRSVAGTGDGVSIGIVTVLIPRAFFLQPMKPAVAEQRIPARQIIAAHLIENDQNRELRLRLGRLFSDRQRRDKDKKKTREK